MDESISPSAVSFGCRRRSWRKRLEAPKLSEVGTMKTGSNGTDPVLDEAEISSVVETGGGRYIGVLKEASQEAEAIVLFISRQTRSTLTIPVSRLTVEAVRRQLAESDAAFSKPSIPKETHCTGTKKQ
jgi:hypothetical protein